MLESATAFTAQPQNDAGYKDWRNAVKSAVMRLDPQGRTAGPIPNFGKMVHDTAMAASAYASNYAPSVGAERPDITYASAAPKDGEDPYTFDDVLDVINPLQHIPVLDTIYRKITGDTIKPMSKIIGGAIFGGPIGAVASTVDVIVKDRTGKDVAENALTLAGFNTTPDVPQKPDLTYQSALNNTAPSAGLPGTTLAFANLSIPSTPAPKNFAAKHSQSQIWNA